MVAYSHRMVPEIFQTFWAGMAAGEFITDATAAAGTFTKQGTRWLATCGGVRPRRGRNLKGRCLTFAEREEIAIGIAAGHTLRHIAKALNRSPSTISREVARNSESCGRYRARSAHAAAYHRASRPKTSKLATNLSLRQKVEESLNKRHSPEQIAGRLRLEYPDDPQMRVSAETIYQSLYQPSRGGLEHTLTRSLRTGRKLRRPCRKAGQRKNRIPDMINIANLPKDVKDRAVPGHWEGDLIVGKRNLSAIGTLVERATGMVELVHLPDGYKPEHTARALTDQLETLPTILRRTLTWDQGSEMRDWKEVSAATGIDIYFCDPHAPWQRGTNENTNGELRQYFAKGSDLGEYSKTDLEWVSQQLNERPRKQLGFHTPAEEMERLLLQQPDGGQPDLLPVTV